MADCLAAQLLDGVGDVIDAIDGTGDWSQDIETIQYDFVNFNQLDRDNYPLVIIFLSDLQTEEIDNESQQISVTFRIIGYIQQDSEGDTTSTGRKELLEFGADFRTAILTMYDNQQAGSFSMDEFEIIGPIRQVFSTDDAPDDVGIVLTEFDCKFVAARDER